MKKLIISILIILSLIGISYAIAPMQSPKVQMFDNSGNPLNGGKIYFYEAGSTSTPKDTYTDSTGLVANTNPVILDSSGRASIWLSGYYKVVVKTSAGVTLYTADYISASPEVTALSSNVEWLDGPTPTYLSANSFSVASDYTSVLLAGRRVKTTNAGGTIYGTISSASYTPSITTVNIVPDSGSLDVDLSAMKYGILNPTYPSIPIYSNPTKTASYTITVADMARYDSTIFATATNQTVTITLPSASSVPIGARVSIVSASSSTATAYVTVSGNIGSITSYPMQAGSALTVVSNGSSWWSTKPVNGNFRGAMVYGTNAYTSSSASVTWLGVAYDTEGMFSKSTPSYFTITSNISKVKLQAQIKTSAVDNANFKILKNDLNFIGMAGVGGGRNTGSSLYVMSTATVTCALGDKFSFNANGFDIASDTTGTMSWFSIEVKE